VFIVYFIYHLAKLLQAKDGCLVQFVRVATTLLKDEESARDNHFLACNVAKMLTDFTFFTDRLNNKPFLIRLLTTPP